MDLLASLGQIAGQISASLQGDNRLNAQHLIGDLSKLFDAIRDEVRKDEGLVLSFVLDTNLRAIEALFATESEALRDVDKELVHAFIKLGQTWRKSSNILKEIEDPTNADLVPRDHLDEIEAKNDELVLLLTDPINAPYISPSLSGVTRDMAAYPWDKDDPERNRLMRASAFGVLAYRIKAALQSPPSVMQGNIGFYATLLSLAAAIVALF